MPKMSKERETFIVLVCVLAWASMSMAAMDNYPENVKKECSLTRYPNLCVQTLMAMGSSGHPNNVDIISALVKKTIHETNLSSSYFSELSSQVEAEDSHSDTGCISDPILCVYEQI